MLIQYYSPYTHQPLPHLPVHPPGSLQFSRRGPLPPHALAKILVMTVWPTGCQSSAMIRNNVSLFHTSLPTPFSLLAPCDSTAAVFLSHTLFPEF